jgi:uroporphyrin-III C-methyltransferase/precorrin-2 dehydrogenase/sirohydrochlorin ferrochelatase
MDYLPLFAQLRQQPCLLVGGGEVALRKARMLVKAGAILTVVAPSISAELQEILDTHSGHFFQRYFLPQDIHEKFLVVAATDDMDINQQISRLVMAAGKLVNVVDQPHLSNVVFPAIVDRSPLIIAVSSGGKSPILARMLKAQLETLIPAAYGHLALFAGKFREQVKKLLLTQDQRRHFWEKILQGPIGEAVLAGRVEQAEHELLQQLNDANKNFAETGEVYLVGSGPGDPDLLTFKALRLMQKADVVLYDRLVAPAILDRVRLDAERIYVGKAKADHVLPQQDINDLLVKLAKQGKRVLRLKGGDPFIFGRGGEEIGELAKHRIPFQVVPGITAASGCAAYSGIPLTHRDYAQSVRFVTGHLKDNSMNLPWDELVKPNQTVVVYMGLTGLDIICRKMIEYGRAPDTPVALIQQGTMPAQKVVVGTLENLSEKVAAEQIKAPSLMIIGEVVLLRESLNWYQ